MGKKSAIFATAAILAVSVAYASGPNGDYNGKPIVKVIVNGNEVQSDSPAYIDGTGRTYVPIRFVAQALGASISWNSATYTATISSSGGGSSGVTKADVALAQLWNYAQGYANLNVIQAAQSQLVLHDLEAAMNAALQGQSQNATSWDTACKNDLASYKNSIANDGNWDSGWSKLSSSGQISFPSKNEADQWATERTQIANLISNAESAFETFQSNPSSANYQSFSSAYNSALSAVQTYVKQSFDVNTDVYSGMKNQLDTMASKTGP
jgi:hypothetical protein